ncbi:hypothetical protein HPG69_009189 [Diceros bicornis minor]|uniref:Uncharacterized protein n=1 Tax=Diceros bicornis minor TaxID=77932 RepID=A0A7J7EZQ7_DICBM|nr:hypothetical protein HPG69_009189 [Diceros bicornis minor]
MAKAEAQGRESLGPQERNGSKPYNFARDLQGGGSHVQEPAGPQAAQKSTGTSPGPFPMPELSQRTLASKLPSLVIKQAPWWSRFPPLEAALLPSPPRPCQSCGQSPGQHSMPRPLRMRETPVPQDPKVRPPCPHRPLDSEVDVVVRTTPPMSTAPPSTLQGAR